MTNRTMQLVRLAGLASLLAVGVACHGILTVDNPGQIADANLNSKDAVPGLVAGMSNRVSSVMGDIGNDMVIFTGLVTGEFFHGGSYAWAQVPEGLVTPQDDGEPWGGAQQARWVAESGIARIDSILSPSDFASSKYVARAYLLAALANRNLGENFCSAVIDGGAAQPYTAYFDRAMGQADTAITIGQAATATDVVDAAYGVRASLKAWSGDWAGAATDAQMVPANFVYDAILQLPSPSNDIWYETHTRNEYTVYNTFMSNDSVAAVEDMDGPAWQSSHFSDPRAPWDTLHTASGAIQKGANGNTPAFQQKKYDTQTTDIPLVKGTEMLLLRAEAALRQSTPDTASAYALMNQARDVYGMAHLSTAPDLVTAWKDLHYERSVTLWLEGRHLWDASRWYNETGPMHSDQMAGRDQCLPISLDEINANSNLSGYQASLTHPLMRQQ
jgi:starch-binding outer membrane protein, SusD/RagB family